MYVGIHICICIHVYMYVPICIDILYVHSYFLCISEYECVCGGDQSYASVHMRNRYQAGLCSFPVQTVGATEDYLFELVSLPSG